MFKEGDIVEWIDQYTRKVIGYAIVLRNAPDYVRFAAWRAISEDQALRWGMSKWGVCRDDHSGIDHKWVRHVAPEDAERIWAEYTAARLTGDLRDDEF